jgi:hypothetical protein
MAVFKRPKKVVALSFYLKTEIKAASKRHVFYPDTGPCPKKILS